MGVSVHYWAVPPSSKLFHRLRVDKPFAVLMAYLFPYGREATTASSMNSTRMNGRKSFRR